MAGVEEGGGRIARGSPFLSTTCCVQVCALVSLRRLGDPHYSSSFEGPLRRLGAPIIIRLGVPCVAWVAPIFLRRLDVLHRLRYVHYYCKI